jgi:hypothetical protein
MVKEEKCWYHHIPIVGELTTATPQNWFEAGKELFLILFFSLMPLWLGLLIVSMLMLPDTADGFVSKFASSSDLGILSASLLGPVSPWDSRTGLF